MIMGLVTPTSGTVTRAGRADAERALSRAAPDEFRKPLCGHADAAHGAAKSVGVRAALRRRRYRRAHRRARRRSRARPNFSTGRPASCRPGRRRACRSPRRCSTARKSCCSTSRPPRSIPTPPTGCAAGSSVIAAEQGATVLLASHNMTEVERLCERVIIMKTRPHRGRRHAGAAARPLWPRDAGRGVPRRRARARGPSRGRAMTGSDARPRFLRQPRRAPWCGATGICCARPGRACST